MREHAGRRKSVSSNDSCEQEKTNKSRLSDLIFASLSQTGFASTSNDLRPVPLFPFLINMILKYKLNFTETKGPVWQSNEIIRG